MWPENIFMCCIYLLAFMEIAFSHYRFHHIHNIQDKHLRVDAEGHCDVLEGVAHWYDGRGWLTWLHTRHVPAEDPLAVRTMASAYIIAVVRSVGVSRNILGAGGHILWLGGR